MASKVLVEFPKRGSDGCWWSMRTSERCSFIMCEEGLRDVLDTTIPERTTVVRLWLSETKPLSRWSWLFEIDLEGQCATVAGKELTVDEDLISWAAEQVGESGFAWLTCSGPGKSFDVQRGRPR